MSINASDSFPASLPVLDLNSLTLSSGTTVSLNAHGVRTLNVPSSISLGSSISLTLNGAFDVASVDGILAACINGSSSSGSLTIGGTSVSPTVLPEIDNLNIPGTGGSEFILSAAGNQILVVGYDPSIPFSNSTSGSGTMDIGTQDSPSTSDLAGYIASNLSSLTGGGISGTASGNVVEITAPTFMYWPLSLADLGTGASLSTVQAGQNRTAQLVAAGMSVSTN